MDAPAKDKDSATYYEQTLVSKESQLTDVRSENQSSNDQDEKQNCSKQSCTKCYDAPPVDLKNEYDSQNNEFHCFYNEGFSLSPSEFKRHWRHRTSLKDCDIRESDQRDKIVINRYPVDNTYINRIYGSKHNQSENSLKRAARYIKNQNNCNFAWFMTFFMSLFPVLSWLPKYKKEYLISDIIAGLTISILHIPQGMAYGVLASLNAENGLYVSVFPVLIYFIFGTSRHVSLGTFAVISLLVSSAVYDFSTDTMSNINSTDHNLSNFSIDPFYGTSPSHLEIATALTVAVGFWQLFLGAFQLGSLSVVLSDQLVSGFTSGVACHVVVSLMKNLVGVRVGRYSGLFKLVYTLGDVFKNLSHTNIASVVISATAIFVLVIFKEQINQRLRARLKMLIPIDIIVVVLATIVSYFGKFKETYKINVIEDIPIGVPYPVPPRLDLIPRLITESFAIAVVTFVTTLSMGKLMSKKHKYNIRPNQELLALGCANVFASFFACFPCCTSLSRTIMQEGSGGKTQVAGLVSCCVLLVVLLALAPLLYSLPMCILSCIIMVALKPMFVQVKDFFKSWRVSKLDALIWLVTFISTVLLDVTYGLLVGVVFSLITVTIRSMIPSRTFLGRITDTDLYLDSRRYDMVEDIKGVKIYHFESALYFINKEIFKESLLKHIPLGMPSETKDLSNDRLNRIIIDCSTFTFIDISGLETLLEVMKDYHDFGITVFLSGCSSSMQAAMEKYNFYERVPQHPFVFPTINDAVKYQFLPRKCITV